MENSVLPVLFENIPRELKVIHRWVLWNFVQVGEEDNKRWAKMPVRTNGSYASSSNPDTWTDFLTAETAYLTGKFSGVGFVFDGTDNLVGVDLDDCFDIETGTFTNPEQEAIARGIQGYMEISPSGTGVKIFTRADLAGAHVDHDKGIEAYKKGRYFTVTGNALSGTIPTEIQDLSSIIPARTISDSGDAFSDYSPTLTDWDLNRVEKELLSNLDPDCGYDEWLQVGQCLHHQFEGDTEAMEAWDRWSEGSPKYTGTGNYSCHAKWDTFKGNGRTLRSLIFLVSQKTLQKAIDSGEVVLDYNSPVENAKKFLEAEYSEEQGFKLIHYASDFYLYAGTHYRLVEEATIRSAMYRFLTACKKMVKGKVVPFNPTATTVSGVLDALKAFVHLEQVPETRPPVWQKKFITSKPPAEKLVSVKNGLYHLDNDMLLPHSLGFFNTHSLPFDYDPTATCPRWETFLDEAWPSDQESKDLLMEYIGYVLSGDTKQQKYLSVIGPRRSGKGTINKIMVALLGQNNVVSPQIEELCDTFALQSWLGKPLASFSDARLTGRNTTGVVSQLLRIVGGDPVTVNRKNKESLDVFLPTRIVMFSNEALQLSENSNALTGRMLVLQMTNSFYGKEDVGLYDKLADELSGIFNMAMRANKRRLARHGERFIQPQSAQATLEMASEIANPISTFIDDSIVYDKDGTIDKDDLFAVYRKWAMKQNIGVGTALSFKRRFVATTQDHGVSATRSRTNGDAKNVYTGVRLNEKAQKYIDSMTDFDKEGF